MKKKFFSVVCVLLCLMCVLLGCTIEKDKTEGQTPIGQVSFVIECKTILNNMDLVDKGLIEQNCIPQNGVILQTKKCDIFENDTVYDLIKRECKKANIRVDYSYNSMFDTYYIKGVNHIYEMSVGSSSGWLYFVNGEMFDKGISLYKLKNGDEVRLAYTCKPGDLNQ